MEDEHKELKEIILQTNSYFLNPFVNFCCDECSLPLEDYGCEPLIFSESNSFADRLLCYKCSADFFGEDDYHYEKVETDYENIIVVESTKQGMQARIRGMQTMVCDVFKSLALGMTEKDILKKYPHLTHKDILACYAFAAERI